MARYPLEDHDVDLTGKRVVIVGSAASAVQIVPELARIAGHLTVLQTLGQLDYAPGKEVLLTEAAAAGRCFPFLITLTQKWQAIADGSGGVRGHDRP